MPQMHQPLHPPRSSAPMEGIYLKLWQEYAERHPEQWARIFCTADPVGQRASSVAASFMVYMGCGDGQFFTRRAEKLWASGAFDVKEDAYRAAWALHNARRYGIDNNLRVTEYMLAGEYPIGRFGHVNWDLVPAVTQEDNDVVESMACWWAGADAQSIREAANAQYAARIASDLQCAEKVVAA